MARVARHCSIQTFSNRTAPNIPNRLAGHERTTDPQLPRDCTAEKTLKERHEELIALRQRPPGTPLLRLDRDREIVTELVYDVKALDRAVTRVAREIRLLEQAMRATNARTVIEGYDQNDAVLEKVV